MSTVLGLANPHYRAAVESHRPLRVGSSVRKKFGNSVTRNVRGLGCTASLVWGRGVSNGPNRRALA
jgi:hypothetical protein